MRPPAANPEAADGDAGGSCTGAAGPRSYDPRWLDSKTTIKTKP